MNSKQRLELTWVGKEIYPKIEPRVLIEDPSLSYHAHSTHAETGIFDNLIIRGDNLLALKALEQQYFGKARCIFIDPPYNTGSAFEFYDDGIEHSVWLSLMRHRLEILRNLLASNGTLWITIDDNEVHYLKVLCDEIFGRGNFINQVSVKMKLTAGASGGGEDKRLKKNIEYILVYAKDYNNGFAKFNDVFDEENLFAAIDEMEANEQSWKYTSILVANGHQVDERVILDGAGEPITVKKYKGLQRTTVSEQLRAGRSREDIYTSSFEKIFSDTNAQTSIRQRIIDEFGSLEKDELLVAAYVPRSGRDKNKMVEHYYISPTIRRVIWLRDTAEKRGKHLFKREKAGTLWQGLPLNNLTKEGNVRFPNGKKPEALLKKILDLATDPGDLVLDSFAGSGTTGSVAHKMGRRWIMVETEEHSITHIVPRLRRVIDGEDEGGVTREIGWQGGGGFRYFNLAPSLLAYDRHGNLVISASYDAALLAEAVCKLMGFVYAPSSDPSNYWQHGRSTESDYVYVTTQSMTFGALKLLAEDVGEERTLLVCCKAYSALENSLPNLTLRKIPQAVLDKCEWGRDDYSLRVRSLPSQLEEACPIQASLDLSDGQVNE